VRLLAEAWTGDSPELLVGAPLPGRRCCAYVSSILLGLGGTPRRSQTLVGGLGAAATATLLELSDGRRLAVTATADGVWVNGASRAGRYGPKRRLTPSGTHPVAVVAAVLAQGRSVVAWTESPAPVIDDRSVFVSYGARETVPTGRSLVLTLPTGHQIDELAIAAGAGGRAAARPALAWVESWTDVLGAQHSGVSEADLGGTPQPVLLSAAGALASGVTLAADEAGDQVAVWKECFAAATSCRVRVASRRAMPAGGTFGPAATLGTADPAQAPQAAVSPAGDALAGWIAGERVVIRVRRGWSGRFASPQTLSRSPAGDLTLAAGPAGEALALWTQGAGPVSVFGSLYAAAAGA
jgi:hypothetical protein